MVLLMCFFNKNKLKYIRINVMLLDRLDRSKKNLDNK